MTTIGGIVLAVLILLAMVTIHEFGHYIAGKILGFRINEFSVGFGPAIFKKRSKKTGELFALRAIPLGGYCAFDGEDEYEENEVEPVAKRGMVFELGAHRLMCGDSTSTEDLDVLMGGYNLSLYSPIHHTV